jgi:hypothetical protein
MNPVFTIMRHVRQGKVTEEQAIQALVEVQRHLDCGYERIAFVPMDCIIRKEQMTKLLLKQVRAFAGTQNARFRRHIRFDVSYFIYKHYFESHIKASYRVRRRKDTVIHEIDHTQLKPFVNLSEIFPFSTKEFNQVVELYRGKRALFSLAYDHKKSCAILTVSLGIYFCKANHLGHFIASPRFESDLH